MGTLDTVIGGSGVRLAVRSAGPADGPALLLLHGWAQSGRVWSRQLTGSLAGRFRLVAADLRGHGDSDKPSDGYDRGAEWAADVRALLEFTGTPTVLVGWSYGGLVITDYLRAFGTAGLVGIVFVGAITEIGRGHQGGLIGPAMRAALPAALSDELPTARAALTQFVSEMGGATGSAQLLADALATPARVRAALFHRNVSSAEALAAVDVPSLVVHGGEDRVVDQAAGRYAAALLPGARARWLADVGHLPFIERPMEFDAELAAFTERCLASRRLGE